MDQITAILDRLLALHPLQIDLSLDRMHRLLAALGNPERAMPPAIHVAGTNGKGSVTATMRAILEADGKRCHVYTSPHLVRFNERIRLGSTGEFVDTRLNAFEAPLLVPVVLLAFFSLRFDLFSFGLSSFGVGDLFGFVERDGR